MINCNYYKRDNENPLGSLVKYTLIIGAGFILGIPIGALSVAYINQPTEEIKNEVKIRKKPSKIENYVAQTEAISLKSANTSTNITEIAR